MYTFIQASLVHFWLTSSSLVAHKGICHMWFKHILESMVMPKNASTNMKKKNALHYKIRKWYGVLFWFTLFSTCLYVSEILHFNHFEILLGKSGHLNTNVNKRQLGLTNACKMMHDNILQIRNVAHKHTEN